MIERNEEINFHHLDLWNTALNYSRFEDEKNRPEYIPLKLWRENAENMYERIYSLLVYYLPHGSGIDADWQIEKITEKAITVSNSYHAMDDYGHYIEWLDFNLTIKSDWEIHIEFAEKNELTEIVSEYLYDIFESSLLRLQTQYYGAIILRLLPELIADSQETYERIYKQFLKSNPYQVKAF